MRNWLIVSGLLVLAACDQRQSTSSPGNPAKAPISNIEPSALIDTEILDDEVMVLDVDNIPLDGLRLRDIYEQYRKDGAEVTVRRVGRAILMSVHDTRDVYPWSTAALDFSPADQFGTPKIALYELRYDGVRFSSNYAYDTGVSGTRPMQLLRDEFGSRLTRDEARAALREEDEREAANRAAKVNHQVNCARAAEGTGAMNGQSPSQLGCSAKDTLGPPKPPLIKWKPTPNMPANTGDISGRTPDEMQQENATPSHL